MAGSLPWQRCSAVYPASLAKHPQTWTKEEIGAWLRWCAEEYSIEPISPEKFDLNGKALCLLSRGDFMERVPRNGDVLYNCLQSLVSKHSGGATVTYQSTSGSTHELCQRLAVGQRSTASTIPTIPDQLTAARFLLVPSSKSLSPTPSTPVTTASGALPRSNFVPIKPHPMIPIPTYSHRDESIARSGVIFADASFPGPASMSEHQSPGSEHSLDSLRQDRSSDCRLLWEFIYQLLQNKAYCNYVCWEDTEGFVFRIVNPTGLAELWGQQKNRTNMTYEKLSRALRYYYRMNIIKKVQGKRLTYRFLQPPSCIQKGQRGAKPQYKIQMDLMSGQASQQVQLESSRSDVITAGYTVKDEVNDADVDEAISEHEFDSDTTMLEEFEQDSGNSKSSKDSATDQSPVHRSLHSSAQDVPNSIESNKQTSGSSTHTHLTSTSMVSAETPHSSRTVFQHCVTYPSVIHAYSNERYTCSPIIKRESFYPHFHPVQRDVYYPPPRPSSSSDSRRIDPKMDCGRFDTRDIRAFDKHRFSETLHRSLSSDFERSLSVNPDMFRPGQPRSASPRCEVQLEPEDLSTKKEPRTDEIPKGERFKPYKSCYTIPKRELSPVPFLVRDRMNLRREAEILSSRGARSYSRDRYALTPTLSTEQSHDDDSTDKFEEK